MEVLLVCLTLDKPSPYIPPLCHFHFWRHSISLQVISHALCLLFACLSQMQYLVLSRRLKLDPAALH